jgi:aminoglycoside phosphotransferase (APT) family kinase protein
LLASGRAADVYEIDDRWVLRRYRGDFTAEREAVIMRYVGEYGYPVPQVREASGPDLVLERLYGRTMLDEMSRRPWTVLRQGRLLADLHDRLHAIPAPPGLPALPGTGGDTVIHRDLHPLNVMLTDRGPVVIDWSNALRGHGAADVAETWLILATHLPPGALSRMLAAVGRGAFLRAFLKSFDREELERYIPAAAQSRLADRNITAIEREEVARFVDRVAGATR